MAKAQAARASASWQPGFKELASTMPVSVMQLAALQGAVTALMSEDKTFPSAASSSKWTLPTPTPPSKHKKSKCQPHVPMNVVGDTPDPMT